VRWVADQLGHADPALTLRVYAQVIPNDEQDPSFLNFDGPGRPYTAPRYNEESESGTAIPTAARTEKGIGGVSDGDRTRDRDLGPWCATPSKWAPLLRFFDVLRPPEAAKTLCPVRVQGVMSIGSLTTHCDGSRHHPS